MPLFDIFVNLFGLPKRNDNINRGESPNENYDRNDYRNNFWGPNEDKYENTWRETHENYSHHQDNTNDMRNFNIFTDPLEMHRYFEQQMNEMLKSFHGFFGQDSGVFFGNQIPAIEPPPSFEPPNRNLRDQFLKPGYENPHDNSSFKPRVDVDLDGKVNSNDLDNLLKEKPGPSHDVTPYRQQTPQIRTFGQSLTSKTVRKPDGTIETHRTVRDSAGNEETTITRHIGDKQYKVTIKTDKNGQQEKIEDMINIDEHELSRFTDNWNQGPHGDQFSKDSDLNNWFPFDKFFK